MKYNKSRKRKNRSVPAGKTKLWHTACRYKPRRDQHIEMVVMLIIHVLFSCNHSVLRCARFH